LFHIIEKQGEAR